jgi:L-threonylcarbamoyladenylate synthase
MSEIFDLNPKRISRNIINRVATIVREGGIILYPTETIYGLGCNLFNEEAVKRLYMLKKRSEKKPILVLVRNLSMLKELVADVPLLSLRLMKRFWPGPLTLIFRARQGMSELVTAHSGKIGIRISSYPFCLKLLEVCQTPILSTSANISGQKSISEIKSLKQLFVSQVEAIITAHDLSPSPPSTVVDISDGKLKLIREGTISKRQLETVV